MDQIPQIGFGTWQIPKDVCKQSVLDALNSGYTHIDCAYVYGNEKQVGEAFAEFFKTHDRSKYWITTKLWNTHHRPENVEKQLVGQLKDLQLDYVDLYLVHGPFNFKYSENPMPITSNGLVELEKGYGLKDTWRAMEKLVDKKLTRYIGVSKYNQQLMLDLLMYARIKPYCNQIEVFPCYYNKNLIKLCQDHGVRIVGYSPLGSSMPGKEPWIKTWAVDPEMKRMSEKYKKDIGQIVLRWHLQHFPTNYSVLIKSQNPERIRTNLQLYDFELSEAEMAYIDGMYSKNSRMTNTGAKTGVPIEHN